jgi:hypothetical protein
MYHFYEDEFANFIVRQRILVCLVRTATFVLLAREDKYEIEVSFMVQHSSYVW